MTTLLLALIFSCSTTTDSAAPSATLPGTTYDCTREGLVSIQPEPGWPQVAACSVRSCQPADWSLAESLIVPCDQGYTVVVTWR